MDPKEFDELNLEAEKDIAGALSEGCTMWSDAIGDKRIALPPTQARFVGKLWNNVLSRVMKTWVLQAFVWVAIAVTAIYFVPRIFYTILWLRKRKTTGATA
jgi:hypothetical protein